MDVPRDVRMRIAICNGVRGLHALVKQFPADGEDGNALRDPRIVLAALMAEVNTTKTHPTMTVAAARRILQWIFDNGTRLKDILPDDDCFIAVATRVVMTIPCVDLLEIVGVSAAQPVQSYDGYTRHVAAMDRLSKSVAFLPRLAQGAASLGVDSMEDVIQWMLNSTDATWILAGVTSWLVHINKVRWYPSYTALMTAMEMKYESVLAALLTHRLVEWHPFVDELQDVPMKELLKIEDTWADVVLEEDQFVTMNGAFYLRLMARACAPETLPIFQRLLHDHHVAKIVVKAVSARPIIASALMHALCTLDEKDIRVLAVHAATQGVLARIVQACGSSIRMTRRNRARLSLLTC